MEIDDLIKSAKQEILQDTIDGQEVEQENNIKNEISNKIDNSTPMIFQSNSIPATCHIDIENAANSTRSEIVKKVAEKIQQEKLIDKHSNGLTEVVNKQIENDIERQNLIAESVKTDNKVIKQEIKNRLIVLKAEAKRLDKEQKQISKQQKDEHSKINKQSKWELYKDKLVKMKYNYVPNSFILVMLLFFDGIKSFFDSLGTISTSIIKCFKWVFLIGLILIVIFAIPVSREWILDFLGFIK